MDWTKYPNFSEAEMRCRHTGRVAMDPAFMERLQALRTQYGRPMRVTSGYRDRTHPAEARKAQPGTHTMGRAVDIAVRGKDAFDLVALAMDYGFTGIGVQQHGNTRFIHLDDLEGPTRPALWSYP